MAEPLDKLTHELREEVKRRKTEATAARAALATMEGELEALGSALAALEGVAQGKAPKKRGRPRKDAPLAAVA